MQLANRISAYIIVAIYFGSAIALYSQATDGLDFLDKVENINIPAVGEKSSIKETKSTTTPSISTGNIRNNDSGKSSKSTVKVTKKPKVPSKVSNRTQPNSSQSLAAINSPSISTNDGHSKINGETTSNQPTTKPANPLKLVETKPLEDDHPSIDVSKNQKKSEDNVNQIWIDEPLKLNPDFLPGIAIDSIPINEEKLEEPITSKVHPLPALDGNYSIWNSFLEFISNYQKAFYIIGILFLFAIYRLKSGRSSASSRKPSPTIRRMRR